MKRIAVLLFGMIATAGVSLEAAAYDYEYAYRQQREVSGFTGIQLTGSAEVLVTPSDKFEMVIIGEEDDVREYVSKVKNGVLHLTMPDDETGGKGNKDYRIRIMLKAPKLESISTTGSGIVNAFGTWESDGPFNVSTTGSSRVSIINVKAGSYSYKSSGSSQTDAGNLVISKELSVNIKGSGSLYFSDASARDMDVSIQGSGKANIEDSTVDSKLLLSTNGNGWIRINGKTDALKVKISGSGYIFGTIDYNSKDCDISGNGKINFEE